MEPSAPITFCQKNKCDILKNLSKPLAYELLLELSDDALIQIRHTCPKWKNLLDNDEFWEIKLEMEDLDGSSVINSDSLKDCMSFFKSPYYAIFRYFNKLKDNWKGKCFKEVEIDPNIVNIFHIDEEALIYELPNIVTQDDDISNDKRYIIANPETGTVLNQRILGNMGAIVRLKKSGRFVVVEDNLHKLAIFNDYKNILQTQESGRLTHLKIYGDILVTKVENNHKIRIIDMEAGMIIANFSDDNLHITYYQGFKSSLIAIDNKQDRRVRIRNIEQGVMYHTTRYHPAGIKQILLFREDILIVVECDGRISIKHWQQENYNDRQIVFYGRPNSKIHQLDRNTIGYIQMDKVIHIKNANTGDSLKTIGTQHRIEKIKSNSQIIFVLCQDMLKMYDKKNYEFLEDISYPFKNNTIVLKIIESKLLFQNKHPDKNSSKFCLYNFSPRLLKE